MKPLLKKLGLGLLVIFVILQFFPAPKNRATEPGTQHISRLYSIPAPVEQVLKTACYDCHSNNTRYPWYAHIQPLGWWLNKHITEGKEELNFSSFASYSVRRQYHKLEEVSEMVETEEMPLSSYTFIHRDSRLDTAQKALLLTWAKATRDSMKARYPADSFVRKK